MSDVTTKDFNWADLCKEVDGAPEKETAYEFSNGRVFQSPQEFGGVYTENIDNP